MLSASENLAANVQPSPENLLDRFRRVRAFSEFLCQPLETEDYLIQSIVETSPPKWHLGHVTWFFEAFILKPLVPGYRLFHPDFDYIFNSYYETVGQMHPRPNRGLLSRPTVEQVYAYRHYVDEQMGLLLTKPIDDALAFRVTLGLNHEQQHQELLLMDVKHNFSINPMKPVYRADLVVQNAPVGEMGWADGLSGVAEIGHFGSGFAYDNETPRHRVFVAAHQLANRLVTNGEYLAFIEDQGYERSDLWLSDGWHHIRQVGWKTPLYWQQEGDTWLEFTLGGLRELDLNQPVCHLSHYEADAYARWAGARLPTEVELELAQTGREIVGNFVDNDCLHPQAGSGQWYGDVWEWTQSAYAPYPGFKPLEGSMGEYNGKFMCNQMVLRGGCCVTSQEHLRATYRNFFYPFDRWPVTGLRLAKDA